MKWNIIGLIAVKELLETLRDKRTLLTMILVPVIFYPGLILLLTQVASVQMAKMENQVAKVGFAGEVVTPELEELVSSSKVLKAIESAGEHTRTAVRNGSLHLLIEPSSTFSEDLNNLRTAEITLYYDEASELSQLAANRFERALQTLKEKQIAQRLTALKVNTEAITPVKWSLENIAPPSRMGGYILGKILPIFLIMAIVLGAFYPAVDLTAGEKERGTLQTLLTAPIDMTNIIAGKFLAVSGITLLAGFVNLGSIALFFGQAQIFGEMPHGIHLELSGVTIVLLAITITVLALFFSAILMTVAVLARSFKEAQTYLTPVYLACFLPAILAQLPGVQLSMATAWVPGMNLALTIQSILLESFKPTLVLTALGATLLYTILSLRVAGVLFRREAVLLGDVSGVEAIFEHKAAGPKLRIPSLAEALALYGVVFILVLYGGGLLQQVSLAFGILITPFVLVFGTTWIWARFAFWDLKSTFNWHEARSTSWLGGALLGLGAWALVLPLVAWLNDSFLPLPTEMIEKAAELLSTERSLLAAIAIDFGITFGAGFCEEFLFRGPILNSARKSMPAWAAVAITALLFAVLHLSVHRLAGTFLLGLVAGWIVVVTGSIFPAMLFHTTHNALVVTMGRLSMNQEGANAEFPEWALAAGATLALTGAYILMKTARKQTAQNHSG